LKGSVLPHPVGADAQQGLRRTPPDKRRAVCFVISFPLNDDLAAYHCDEVIVLSRHHDDRVLTT